MKIQCMFNIHGAPVEGDYVQVFVCLFTLTCNSPASPGDVSSFLLQAHQSIYVGSLIFLYAYGNMKPERIIYGNLI